MERHEKLTAEYGENNSRLIKLVEKQEPDMIAITGDLVDASKTDIEIAKTLAGEFFFMFEF